MATKVLLISDTVYDANGVSRFIQDMAQQSRQKHIGFSVLSSSPLAGEHPEANIRNIKPVWAIRMPFYQEQFLTIVPPVRSMYRHIKALSPDVIHISTPGPLGFVALMAAKRLKIPVAGTYHTDFPSYMGKQMKAALAESVTRWFMRRFYHRMGLVFSRSKRYMDILENKLGIRPEQMTFIPPGTDIATFNPRHRSLDIWKRFGIDAERLKLIYVGRLSAEKNFMFVIDLFEQMQQRTDRLLSLIVIGEGTQDEAVRRRQNAHIHLLGVQKGLTLSQLYATSDLMLFASVTETLGQVVMEAQASQLPCMVSDRGGVTDIVAHETSGYCLDVADEAGWLEKAVALIEDDEKRAAMGRAGFEQMQARTITKTFDAFIHAHEILCSTVEPS